MMKKIVVLLLTFILFPTFINTAMCQPPPPPPQDIPIDSGLFFLLIFGFIFIAKKFHSNPEKNK